VRLEGVDVARGTPVAGARGPSGRAPGELAADLPADLAAQELLVERVVDLVADRGEAYPEVRA
jgi:hypothetical protein